MTGRALFVVGTVIFLAICGPFLKNLSGMAGLPNWLPLVRDPLVVAVAALGLTRAPLFTEARWRWLLLWLLLFVAAYMAVSIVQDRALVGLYYLRFYLLPLLFCVGMLGLLQRRAEEAEAHQMLRYLMRWNLLLFLFSGGLYVLLLEAPRMRPALFGTELLPTAWYISGGTWMRMGLPASGPNGLGLVFALHALLFLQLLLCLPPRESGPGNGRLMLHLGIALIGLLLTFSRSSVLLFLLGGLALLLTPGVLSFVRLAKLLAWSFVALAMLAVLALAFDSYSGGLVSRWVALNIQGRDPSALGHLRSVRDAVEHWSEYLLFGYPRGSVGPKALLFTGKVNNVESSWLGLLYDMGLFNSLPYLLCVATALALGYRHRAQWSSLLALAAPFALLPYVFEADAVLYCFFIYLAAGFVLTKTAPAQRGAR